jgi:hypothetical protein
MASEVALAVFRYPSVILGFSHLLHNGIYTRLPVEQQVFPDGVMNKLHRPVAAVRALALDQSPRDVQNVALHRFDVDVPAVWFQLV